MHLERKRPATRHVPKVKKPVDELVLSNLPVDSLLIEDTLSTRLQKTDATHLESVHHNLLVPRPGRNLTKHLPERLQANPSLRFILLAMVSRKECRWWCLSRRWGFQAHGLVQSIVDIPDLLFGEPFERSEIPDRRTLSEGLDAVNNLAAIALALGEDCLIRDNRELAEGYKQKLLEVGDRASARIRGIGVSRLA